MILTDPVWANSHPDLVGADDPRGVFAAVAMWFPLIGGRAVVHLGCDSDPRMLDAVPAAMPFLRACWLRRNPPGYKGPILISSDVVYVFGHGRLPRGARVLPGEGEAPSRARRPAGVSHPCPRNERGVAWLLRWFVPAGCSVVDPFAGSCTTLRVAQARGVEAVGIEIDERWCEEAAQLLEVDDRQGRLDIQAVEEAAERP